MQQLNTTTTKYNPDDELIATMMNAMPDVMNSLRQKRLPSDQVLIAKQQLCDMLYKQTGQKYTVE